MDTHRTGTLVLVAGPSGVGKDSLINGARRLLADREQITFVTREITRPPDETDSEDYINIDDATFYNRKTAGHYALTWAAHGFNYGLPAKSIADVERGRLVVANAFRGVIDGARARFENVRIISVTAPKQVLAQRLEKRGRESPDEIVERLARAAAFHLEGPDVIEFCNDKPLREAIHQFAQILLDLAHRRH